MNKYVVYLHHRKREYKQSKNTEMTRQEQLLQRLAKDWTKVAGENIVVEALDKDSVMARCSEIAAFRIVYDYYKGHKDLSKTYSENLNSFVVIMELSIEKYL